MKIGSDAVLFGCWIPSDPYRRILDIGTGTGILSLILAQNNPQAQIVALEIDPEACLDARHNISNSPCSNRIELVNENYKQFSSPEEFDCLVSNPPFFHQALRASTPSRTTARHTDQLHWQNIVGRAKDLLMAEGSIFLMLPASEEKAVKSLESPWNLRRICYFQSRPDRDPHRIFIQLDRSTNLLVEERLIYQDEPGKLSEKARELTANFYLD